MVRRLAPRSSEGRLTGPVDVFLRPQGRARCPIAILRGSPRLTRPLRTVWSVVQGRPCTGSITSLIPPEIKDDLFAATIRSIARRPDVHHVLEIGSSAGDGSTAAFVAGLREHAADARLFCMEVSLPRYRALQAVRRRRLRLLLSHIVGRSGRISDRRRGGAVLPDRAVEIERIPSRTGSRLVGPGRPLRPRFRRTGKRHRTHQTGPRRRAVRRRADRRFGVHRRRRAWARLRRLAFCCWTTSERSRTTPTISACEAISTTGSCARTRTCAMGSRCSRRIG